MSIPESEKETIALAQEELDILDAIRRHGPSHRLDPKLSETYGVWTVCFRRYCHRQDLPWLWMTSVSKFMDYLDAHPNVSTPERDRALDGIMFYLTDVRPAEQDEDDATESSASIPDSTKSLFAQLLLQCDLQITEAMQIRLEDVRLNDEAIVLHDNAEHDSRTVSLPSLLRQGFEKHVRRVEERSTGSNPRLFGHRGLLDDPSDIPPTSRDSDDTVPRSDEDLRRSTEVATRVMKTLDEAEPDDEED